MIGSVFEQRAPLLLRGACERARAKWTDEWLVAQFAGRACNVARDSRPGQRDSAYARKLPLERFLDEHGRTPPTSDVVEYLFETTLGSADANERLADLDLPPALLGGTITTLSRLFTGPAGSGVLPHIHPKSCAINALALGRKRWVIYEESDSCELYAMFQQWAAGSQASTWFSEECPKLRTRELRLWEFVQEAGDVVVVPKGYVHGVVNLSAVTGFTVEVARA